MRRARYWLILAHRYLGILLAPLFLIWFCSGVAMVYLRGMPELSEQERIAHLKELDPTTIRITPSQASEIAGFGNHPHRLVLTSVLERPVYQIGNSPITVFADTGEHLGEVGRADAIAIGGRFLGRPSDQIVYAGFLTEPDQWTLTLRRHLPVHKLAVDDSSETELYVSAKLGEVVNVTTRRSRALAWISAVPHWLYFEWLRTKDRLWRQVILWTAGLAAVSSFIGLVLAIVQFSVPYHGWLRWHYRAGAIFGLTTLTWVFSGFLSMEPWFWSRTGSNGPAAAIAEALSGGPLDVSAFPRIETAKWVQALRGFDVREIEFHRIQGQPYLAVRGAAHGLRLLDASSLTERRAPFPIDSLVARVKAAVPDSTVVDALVVEHHDSYYYSRDPLPLPVLRVKFDDRERTWVYVDPAMDRVVAQATRRERVQRWLYHGLHSLDFPWLYDNRPLWDVVIVTLCLGGATLSAIGVVLAGKRVTGRSPRRSQTRSRRNLPS